jgi:3-hexulose-6-phosphate synthase/6-phospho-3-hexuloisomerase
VSVPVQAVGGLSIQQAIECATRGAPLVVVGAPLVIDGAAFRPASSDLFPVLRRICDDVHCIPLRAAAERRASVRHAERRE